MNIITADEARANTLKVRCYESFVLKNIMRIIKKKSKMHENMVVFNDYNLFDFGKTNYVFDNCKYFEDLGYYVYTWNEEAYCGHIKNCAKISW